MEIKFKQYFNEGDFYAEVHIGDQCVYEARAKSMQAAFDACDAALKNITGLSYLEAA